MVSIRSRTPIVIAAVIVVAAAAALLAVMLRRGSDDDATDRGASATAADATASAPGGGAPIVYGAVEVSGQPLPPFQRADGDPAIGMTAPALAGTTYTGAPIEIVPGQGGPTMLMFIAHWCPHCNDEIPVLNDWRDSGEVPEDLQVVGVSTAVTDQRPNYPPAQWLDERGWTWPAMADDQAASAFAAYGGTSFPYIVVIGADGTVKARAVGELPVEQLDALADSAVA
jgi:cytochrome c biogenesis protein CcmG, thiol:disulfide interchange protein DsbE